MNDETERITELEIRLAWQNELLESLDKTVAKLQHEMDLQQAQLRLLYRRLNEKNNENDEVDFSLRDEIPPHY